MASNKDGGNLKRDRDTAGDESHDLKKPRRSSRITRQLSQLPTPITNNRSSSNSRHREGTATPPEGRPSQIQYHHTRQGSTQLESPPVDTQPFSQLPHPSNFLSDEVKDEDKEQVWGYLVPLDSKFGNTLVLRRRGACPVPQPKTDFGKASKRRAKGVSGSKEQFLNEEESYEESKEERQGYPAGGYLIGRHRECDRVLDLPTISNRHCLLFNETKDGDAVAILQDLSSNGTFVNEVIVGRNKHRELQDGDEVTILDQTRFVFRYPKNRDSNAFRRQYRVLDQLGRGHFATVYLCVEKSSGYKYAVKKFERRKGDRSDNLKQEIAVLMSVSHPNMLCLRDSYEEEDGVYLVLELAPEGELFNWIVMKQKLSEPDARKVFIQLFQGIKYLHDRGIVHRDIKPENILLVDKELSVKLADFGLAKIIGESSFTTTLCGTPSYVAPEILENSKHRKYTRAVDIWSLGVVLYICLCGFPPFSDELNTPENPYTLAQQIRSARFDYPSPYWDSVGDPALDLIDKMLTVDSEKRATVEECLEHPWVTQKFPDPSMSMDSTDGLSGALQGLDFSKRKVARERTLLSSLNSVRVAKAIDNGSTKVWEKHPLPDNHQNGATAGANGHEQLPDANRAPREFMEMGGKGDMELFGTDTDSRYHVNGKRTEPTKGVEE